LVCDIIECSICLFLTACDIDEYIDGLRISCKRVHRSNYIKIAFSAATLPHNAGDPDPELSCRLYHKHRPRIREQDLHLRTLKG
jgi:hypothetical protein